MTLRLLRGLRVACALAVALAWAPGAFAAQGIAKPVASHPAPAPVLRLPPGLDKPASPAFERWLQPQIQRIQKEKAGAQRAADLAALAASLRRAAQAPAVPQPGVDPRAAAAAIVAQRAYQTGGAGPAPPPRQTWLEIVLSWLRDAVGRLIDRLFGAAASQPIVGKIVAVIYIVALVVLAGYLIVLLVSAIARRYRPATRYSGMPIAERIDPDAFYERALAASAQGQYARAVALLFQASLATFDRTGILPFDGSLTAGEYRRAVRRSAAAASPHFDEIARTFVMAAFAERPVTSGDFALADRAYRALTPVVAA